jgi:hypothetical protein
MQDLQCLGSEGLKLSDLTEDFVNSLAQEARYDEETSTAARRKHLEILKQTKQTWWELIEDGKGIDEIDLESQPERVFL